MIFEQILAGGDRNFAYLIGDETTRQGAIIDPSYEPERSVEAAGRHGLRVLYVISTHSHPDHVAGNAHVVQHTGATEVLHASSPHSSALRVKDNEVLAVGTLNLRVLHTPGHIPDHLCVLAGSKLITGDLLFIGKIGGTGLRFAGSDPRQQWESLQRLVAIDPATEVWPGHDYGVSPSSTIGHEIATNPFLLCKTLDDFLYLKDHWAEYKKAHNIV